MYADKGRMLGHFKSNEQPAPYSSAGGSPQGEMSEPETAGIAEERKHPEKN